MSLGKNIATLRKSTNLTQEAFANNIGISRGALSMYELDKREPDNETLIRIANYLKVSTDYLLGNSNDEISITTSITTEHILGNLDDLSNDDIKILKDMIAHLRNKNKK